MKTKKPRLEHNPIEYRLLVEPRYDDTQGREVLFIGLRTIKEFSNFQYELVVTDKIEGDTLYLGILGLRAPNTNVPTTGVAVFSKIYEFPLKVKNIIVQKMDKKENSFTVRITAQKSTVKSIPDNPFVELVTTRQAW